MREPELLANLASLRTTELGALRVRKNLSLTAPDVLSWARQLIANSNDIFRQGKNWYITAEGIRLTVNAQSLTLITAHRVS